MLKKWRTWSTKKLHNRLPTTTQQSNGQKGKIIQSKMMTLFILKPTTKMYLQARKRRIYFQLKQNAMKFCFAFLTLKQEKTFTFVKYYES